MQAQAYVSSFGSNASCARTEILQERWCYCGGGDSILGSACGCGGRASFADIGDDSSCGDDSSRLGPCACPCHHIACPEDSGVGSATRQCDCDCGSAGVSRLSLRPRMHAGAASDLDTLALNAMYGDDSNGGLRPCCVCCALSFVCFLCFNEKCRALSSMS